MKLLSLILSFTLAAQVLYAQTPDNPPVPEPTQENRVELVEQTATFPGGEGGFYKYISVNSFEPKLIALFGFRGRAVIGFTVDPMGAVKNVHAVSNSGTGYEEELIAIISSAPRWKPAVQNGTPVEEKFAMPFKLDMPRDIIVMKELRKSDYKFTFQIKDQVYNLEEAQSILGEKFSSTRIDYNKSFNEQPQQNKEQHAYLIQIKD